MGGKGRSFVEAKVKGGRPKPSRIILDEWEKFPWASSISVKYCTPAVKPPADWSGIYNRWDIVKNLEHARVKAGAWRMRPRARGHTVMRRVHCSASCSPLWKEKRCSWKPVNFLKMHGSVECWHFSQIRRLVLWCQHLWIRFAEKRNSIQHLIPP